MFISNILTNSQSLGLFNKVCFSGVMIFLEALITMIWLKFYKKLRSKNQSKILRKSKIYLNSWRIILARKELLLTRENFKEYFNNFKKEMTSDYFYSKEQIDKNYLINLKLLFKMNRLMQILKIQLRICIKRHSIISKN